MYVSYRDIVDWKALVKAVVMMKAHLQKHRNYKGFMFIIYRRDRNLEKVFLFENMWF